MDQKYKTHCFRLKKNQDLKKFLIQWTLDQKINAATVLSSVGSLQSVELRLANTQNKYSSSQPHEIINLNGTLGPNGAHLHMSVSDSQGKTWGGHLLDGNLIYTTCELILLEIPNIIFNREIDAATGFLELKMTN